MDIITKVGPILLGFLFLGFYLFLLGCNAKLPPKVFQGKVSILILSLFVILWAGSNTVMRATAPDAGQLVLNDILKEVRPPAQLNDSTRIDSVVLDNNTIIYSITFSTSQAQAQSLSDEIRLKISEQACNEANSNGVALKLGISIELRFKDSENTPMAPFVIRPTDCSFPVATPEK